VHRTVLLSPPDVGPLEREALRRVGEGSWFAPLGPEVDAFERELAETVDRAHVVATSSGTAALHLALVVAGVGPGSVVPTSTFTFAATANAIHHAGARPFFVDVDRDTGNLSPALLADSLDDLRRRGVPVSAVLPVDIYGRAADHDAIAAVAARHGLPVVVDAAESLGARHAGRPAAAHGLASAISFNGNKIVTTSGGGAVTCDDDEIAGRARSLAAQARLPVDHYEHAEVGWNHRLSNVLAALGRAQLGRLPEMAARRRSVRRAYRELVRAVPGVDLFAADDDADDNCWLTSVVLDPASGLAPAEVARSLAEQGIETRRLWKPLHRQGAFHASGSRVSGVADELFATGLTLPSGSSLDDDDLDHVLTALATALARPGAGDRGRA
jgi:dTDP-4-amino-4,6-dideoxygalactose transaminase